MANSAGEADSSAPLTLIQPIRFVKPLQDITVKDGENAILEAETDRAPKTIKWYKNGEQVPEGKTKVGPGNKLRLEIPNAGKDDDAQYKVAIFVNNLIQYIFIFTVSFGFEKFRFSIFYYIYIRLKQ